MVPPVSELMQQHTRQRYLERSLGDRQESELLRDYLALLGDLDVAADRFRRKRSKRAIHRRPATPSNASSSSVEDPKLDSRFRENRGKLFLRSIEGPR